MIQFSWTLISNDSFQIEIRTNSVQIGTLYRLTSAIYVLGLDIQSGDVYTIEEEDGPISHDTFTLRILNPAAAQSGVSDCTTKLGMLMETLLQEDADPDRLLRENKVTIPENRKFFENPPEIVFQDVPKRRRTQFYIETQGRTGLLFHLTRVLSREHINIVQATIRTLPNGMAEDTFYLQFKDAPLGPELSAKLEKLILGEV